jgi:hypothetical protein
MAVIKKGTFAIDIGFVKLGADFEESDRQCAWELYTELATRVALTGKTKDSDCTDFSGEVYSESLSSLYAFFGEARKIMRNFPVGTIGQLKVENHLGAMIHRSMRDVLRPFLETWQADYRHWWEHEADLNLPPFERQQAYPRLKEFISNWSDVRAIMRAIQDELVIAYKLVDVTKFQEKL